MSAPTLGEIRAASTRIAPHVHRTPAATSHTLNAMLEARVYFKCENLQKVGAFKARGAMNAVLRLDADTARRGVITHSSGNHGAALAYAARVRGIPCTVVMPRDAPAIKTAAVEGYGAEIVPCARDERDAVCGRLAEQRGMTLIHPFENPDVVAGQGTCAMELLQQVGELDLVVAPVGGGGLLSGTTIAVKGLMRDAQVWGVEPTSADDARRSMDSGVRQPANPRPDPLCDGLLTGLGSLAFDVLSRHRVRIVTVDESKVPAAGRMIMERMKLVVEPSAAIVLAALLAQRASVRGKRVGAILSGGNTDFRWLV